MDLAIDRIGYIKFIKLTKLRAVSRRHGTIIHPVKERRVVRSSDFQVVKLVFLTRSRYQSYLLTVLMTVGGH